MTRLSDWLPSSRFIDLRPIVTIGICARNADEILPTAIESVVKQNFPHELMEIIFVDDGSEDDTLKVIREYASSIDITSRIFSIKWSGLGKARNIVIENARGEYVTWLDSDEILENDFLRKQFEFIEHHPAAGVVTAKLGIPSEHNPVLVLELIPMAVEYSRQNWANPSKMPGTGGTTYSVRAAHQTGGFDENMARGGEDVDMAGRIGKAGWQILKGNAVFYENHGGLSTWKGLWQRYLVQGKYCRRLHSKTNRFISLYRMNPVASFVAGVSYTVIGYRTTRLKIAFLLPFHFVFKMTAWFYGFSKE